MVVNVMLIARMIFLRPTARARQFGGTTSANIALNEIANTVPATDTTRVVQIKPHTCPSGDGNIHGSATSTMYPSLCHTDDWDDTLIRDLPSIHLPCLLYTSPS